MNKNIKIVKYLPYGSAAKSYAHELWLYKNPITCVFNNVVYRKLPMYLDICVSKSGSVLTVDGKKPSRRYILSGYPSLDVYDTLNKRITCVKIHRLVALAWLDNSDYVKYNIVDHIDNNRTNPNVNNLQWVTASDNMSRRTHGIVNRYCIINAKTGFRVLRSSLSQVAKYVGMSHQHISTFTLPKKICGRGETYIISDTTVMTDVAIPLDVGDSNFTVTNTTTGIVEYFKTKNELVKRYDLAIYPRTIKNATIKLKAMGYTVKDINGVTRSNSYDIKHVKSGKEHLGIKLKEVIDITGSGKSVVLTRINRDYRYGQLMNDWVLKLSNEKEYTINYRGRLTPSERLKSNT